MSPDALERRHHRALRSAWRDAAQGQRILDVLVHGQSPIRLKLWNTSPISSCAFAPRSAGESRSSAGRSASIGRSVGESSSARIARNVDLPQPDGPDTDT